ncbi:metal-sensitive transcriptional regulator [Cellulosimicrobium sp. NPDC057127]|uniref:metal-sensitive transcriptional regulator n=1 Tax=Cellulosimicrobium sp. NPDC057127 TaxID=3346026 RepID=UPI00363E8288
MTETAQARTTTQDAGPTSHDGPHGYASDKEAYLKRMRRIEGQVRGIARMIDEDVYCIDILTQVSAVTKALQAVSIGLVEDHLGHCVVDAARESEEAGAAKVKEAADAIARLVRS